MSETNHNHYETNPQMDLGGKVLSAVDEHCAHTRCFKCKFMGTCIAYNLSPQDVIDYLTEIYQIM